MKNALNETEVAHALTDLPDWSIADGSLTKTFAHPEFMAGIAFVQQVAQLAEDEDHHPDIDIRFRRVTLSLISHDVGAITERDIRFAKAVQELRGS